MDFAETAEQAMLREAVGRIAAKYGHDYFSAKVKSGGHSEELWRDVGAAGFLGVSIPERYGGGGMGITELAIVAEELAAHGCPLMLLMVSPAICGTILARFGTPEQRERWLPGLATGERKMVFAITEPEAGSNSHRLSTSATRDGDAWSISGTKHFISGVDEADAILVVTRTGTDPASGRGRLSLFIVDSEAPGLERTMIPLEIAAPEKQFVLFFDDVAVPGERLLGGEGDGLRQVCPCQGCRVRAPAQCLGRPDRRAPGHRPPPGERQDRGRAGAPGDAESGVGPRPGPPGRRRDVQHGQVRGRRGRTGRARRRHPGPWRQRLRQRVRARRPLGHDPGPAHRAGQPRDDPQLRGRALPRPPTLLLSAARRPDRHRVRQSTANLRGKGADGMAGGRYRTRMRMPPRRLMRTSSRSPGWIAPTPGGAPVKMRSPGSRVMTAEAWATMAGTLVIIVEVLTRCRSAPLTRRRISRSPGSPASSAVVTQGPTGLKVS